MDGLRLNDGKTSVTKMDMETDLKSHEQQGQKDYYKMDITTKAGKSTGGNAGIRTQISGRTKTVATKTYGKRHEYKDSTRLVRRADFIKDKWKKARNKNVRA